MIYGYFFNNDTNKNSFADVTNCQKVQLYTVLRQTILTLFVYSNHLNNGLVWYSNGRFVSGCQMVRYSSGGLKTGLKKACLWSKLSGI